MASRKEFDQRSTLRLSGRRPWGWVGTTVTCRAQEIGSSASDLDECFVEHVLEPVAGFSNFGCFARIGQNAATAASPSTPSRRLQSALQTGSHGVFVAPCQTQGPWRPQIIEGHLPSLEAAGATIFGVRKRCGAIGFACATVELPLCLT